MRCPREWRRARSNRVLRLAAPDAPSRCRAGDDLAYAVNFAQAPIIVQFPLPIAIRDAPDPIHRPEREGRDRPRVWSLGSCAELRHVLCGFGGSVLLAESSSGAGSERRCRARAFAFLRGS